MSVVFVQMWLHLGCVFTHQYTDIENPQEDSPTEPTEQTIEDIHNIDTDDTGALGVDVDSVEEPTVDENTTDDIDTPKVVTNTQAKLGIRFSEIPEGLLVEEVVPFSPAAIEGVEVGDVIISVNGSSLENVKDFLLDKYTMIMRVVVYKHTTMQTMEYTITRAVLEDHPVEYKKKMSPQTIRFQQRVLAHRWQNIDRVLKKIPKEERTSTNLAPYVRIIKRDMPKVLPKVLTVLDDMKVEDPALAKDIIYFWYQLKDWDNVLDSYAHWRSVLPLNMSGIFDPLLLATDYEAHVWATQAFRHSGRLADATALVRKVSVSHPDSILHMNRILHPYQEIRSFALGPYYDMALDTIDQQHIIITKPMTVLNFWASWCGPCQQELPELSTWSALHSDQATVVGVNVDDDLSDVDIATLAQKWNVDIPLVQIQSMDIKFEVTSIPMILVLDELGNLIVEKVGYSSTLSQELDAVLNSVTQRDSGRIVAKLYGNIGEAYLYANPFLQNMYIPTDMGATDDVSSNMMSTMLVLEQGEEPRKITYLEDSVYNPDWSIDALVTYKQPIVLEIQDSIVLVEKDGLVIRILRDGTQILRTVPAPIKQVYGYADLLVVATEKQLVVFDYQGNVLHTENKTVRYIGEISLDFIEQNPHVPLFGSIEESGLYFLADTLYELQYDHTGINIREVFCTDNCMQTNRFTQDGQLVYHGIEHTEIVEKGYIVGREEDHTIVGIDVEKESVQFVVRTETENRFMMRDIDRDGQEELVVVLPFIGVLVCELL